MESAGTTQRKLWRRTGFWLGCGSLLVAMAIVVGEVSRGANWTADPPGSLSERRLGLGVAVYFTFLLIGSSLLCNTLRTWPRKWPGRLWRTGIATTLAIAAFSVLLAQPDFAAEWPARARLVWILILELIFLVAVSTSISAWNFLVWLMRRRMHIWIMAGLSGMLCLAVAFCWEEDWRGRHAWQSYRLEWEAKGEHFDCASFIPPPVPDDQNFAMAPILAGPLASLWTASTNQESATLPPKTGLLAMTLRRAVSIAVTNAIIGKWETGTPTDLNAWQQYYRAAGAANEYRSHSDRPMDSLGAFGTNNFPTSVQTQTPAADVLLVLSTYDQPLAELAEAARRPLARFPIQYQTGNPLQIALPHLDALKRAALVLQLRAIAELAAGQSPAALADVKLILRMSEALKSEPFRISALLRRALLDLAIQPIWEGIRDRRWTEAELTELDRVLARLDLMSEWNEVMRGQRAFDIAAAEYWRHHRDQMTDRMYLALLNNLPNDVRNSMDCLPDLPAPPNCLWDESEDSGAIAWMGLWLDQLPPDGWYELNKVELALDYQTIALTVMDPAKHRRSPSETARAGSMLVLASRGWYWEKFPGSCLGGVLFPVGTSSWMPFFRTQNAIDMARVACALEIYRLHQNSYPPALNALLPNLLSALPPDVINGGPLHYHLLDGDHYRVYSVGWNGLDDGGIVGRKPWGFYDPQAGDRVWQN